MAELYFHKYSHFEKSKKAYRSFSMSLFVVETTYSSWKRQAFHEGASVARRGAFLKRLIKTGKVCSVFLKYPLI